MEKKPTLESVSLFQALLRDHADHDGGQARFAKRLSIGEQTVSRWIKGVNPPSPEMEETIAEELGVSVEELRLLSNISIRDACQLVLDSPTEVVRSWNENLQNERSFSIGQRVIALSQDRQALALDVITGLERPNVVA